MDKLPIAMIKDMERITSYMEQAEVKITQNLKKETLTFTDSLNRKTVMNCRLNSAGATIKQWAGHLNKNTLFFMGDNYEIGCP